MYGRQPLDTSTAYRDGLVFQGMRNITMTKYMISQMGELEINY